jgi:hypothetical protein
MDKDDDNAARDRELKALRAELESLRETVRRLDDMNTIENVLTNGFAKVAVQLEPLKDLSGLSVLAPQRRPLDEAERNVLADVHTSLARPNFSLLERSDPAAGSNPPALSQGRDGGRKDKAAP